MGKDNNKLLMMVLGLLMVMQPLLLFAATGETGKAELDALSGILTGDFGKVIGLAITVWGVWKMFVSGDMGLGFILVACGAALTIFPGVFNFAQSLVVPFARTVSGG